MNILTSYRDHARLRRQLRTDYTDDNVRQYLDFADNHNELRITLRNISAIALGILAAAAAAYNLYNGFATDHTNSILEIAFPFLAAVFSIYLGNINKAMNAIYTRETIDNVNNAKTRHEIMNRGRH